MQRALPELMTSSKPSTRRLVVTDHPLTLAKPHFTPHGIETARPENAYQPLGHHAKLPMIHPMPPDHDLN